MRRTQAALLAGVATVAATALWLGLRVGAGAAITLIGVVLLLALVARYDNHTGSCMMITLLVLLVVAVLCMLTALLVVAATH